MYVGGEYDQQLGGIFSKIKKGVKKVVKKVAPIATAFYAPQMLPLLAASKSAKASRKSAKAAGAIAYDPAAYATGVQPAGFTGSAGGGYPTTDLPGSQSANVFGSIPPAVLYAGGAALVLYLLTRKR